MIKAILFDCFGVLVGKGFEFTYSAAGGDPIKDKAFIEGMFQKSNSGAIPEREFSLTISKKLGLSLEEYHKIVRRVEAVNLPLFDLIEEELKPKYKIAMVSNVNSGVIERKIPKDLRKVFDLEIISADVGFLKPDPKIFEITVSKLGVRYDETIFTDDRTNYLIPASDLGMRTILYTDFESFKQELAKILTKK